MQLPSGICTSFFVGHSSFRDARIHYAVDNKATCNDFDDWSGIRSYLDATELRHVAEYDISLRNVMFGGVGPPGSRCDGFLTNLSHKDRSDVRDEEESKVEEEPEGKNVFL